MNIFYITLIMVLYSFAWSIIFNYKAIESLFVTTLLTIMAIYILTYLFGLSITEYIIISFVCVFFCGSISYAIINRTFRTSFKTFFNSPALLIFILCVFGYAIVMKDAKPISHDDYKFWAFAPKAILKFNGFNVQNRINISSQTFGLPVYYAFITFLTGFSFDVMLTAKWILVWIFLLLPFANHKYKKSLNVFLYAFIIYLVIITDEYMHQYLHSDIVIYSLWAGTVGFYFTNKNSKAKDIVILSGLLFMPQIKQYFGFFITIFTMTFIAFDKLYNRKGKFKKKDIYISIISIIFLLFNLIMIEFVDKRMTKVVGSFMPFQYLPGQIVKRVPWCNLWVQFIKVVKSPFGILMCCMTIILIITGIILLYKNRRKIAITSFIVSLVIFILVLLSIHIRYINGDIYYCLDYNSKLLLWIVPYHLLNLSYLNLPLPYLVLSFLVVSLFFIFLFDKKQKKYFLLFVLVYIFQCLFIIGAIILYFAKSNHESFIMGGMALERYFGVVIYFPIFLFIMYCLGGLCNNNKLKFEVGRILTIIVLVILLFQPEKDMIYKSKEKVINIYHENILKEEKNADIIIGNSKQDEKICIIYDIRNYYYNDDQISNIGIYLQYFSMISTNYFVVLDIRNDVNSQIENLGLFLKENNIDKVLFRNGGAEFNEKFKDLFINFDEVNGTQLYNIIWVNGKPKLKRVS